MSDTLTDSFYENMTSEETMKSYNKLYRKQYG